MRRTATAWIRFVRRRNGLERRGVATDCNGNDPKRCKTKNQKNGDAK